MKHTHVYTVQKSGVQTCPCGAFINAPGGMPIVEVRAYRVAWAEWVLDTLPECLDEFHISCGRSDEDQQEGFFLENGGRLHIEYSDRLYTVRLECRDRGGVTALKGHWLSPNQINGAVDANDFGSMEAK